MSSSSSLLPFLLSELLENPHKPPHHHHSHHPHRIAPEDLLTALLHTPYYRPWRAGAAAEDSGSTVTHDTHKFQVELDVQQFAPQEITVKVSEKNTITVEGKHEEKADEHGFVSRHFVRRYVVPRGHNMEAVESSLSSDGVLTVVVPKIVQDALEERAIPIIQTGAPAKTIKNKAEDQRVNGQN